LLSKNEEFYARNNELETKLIKGIGTGINNNNTNANANTLKMFQSNALKNIMKKNQKVV
jgi:hypothetical protein